MTNGTEKYIETVAYLGKLYDFLNDRLFNNELIKPVITIQADTRNRSYGWWSTQKVWKENAQDDGEHELNIVAQYLNRPVADVAETLIHEMCHQYASVHNLQDCSRAGKYHNKLFKSIAENHGLNVAKADSIGWSITSLKVETAELLKEFEFNYDVIYRTAFTPQVVKSSSTRKYVCPICRASVRATKQVNIMCADCSELMTEE